MHAVVAISPLGGLARHAVSLRPQFLTASLCNCDVQGESCPYPELPFLAAAAERRNRWRVDACGAIEIPLPEAVISVNESDLDELDPGVTVTRVSQFESPSRRLVAEMMIAAGEAAGTLGAREGIPLPYRGQPAPKLPSDETLSTMPPGPCRAWALRRCMTRSEVSPAPVRHASLGLDAYVQVTSPIRRYTDIIAHFQIKAWLRGSPLPFTAKEIEEAVEAGSDMGRVLGRTERAVDEYW